MKLVKYEFKKSIGLRFLVIVVIIMVISGIYYVCRVGKAGNGYDITNIKTLITEYGYDRTMSSEDKLKRDYDELLDTISMEEINKKLMIDGEMTREEYANYAVKLAKAKKMELAWTYVMNQREQVSTNGGWIIFSEYWDCVIHNINFQFANILIVLFTAYVLSFSDRSEYEILISTPKGRKITSISKLVTTSVIIFTSIIVYYVMVLIVMYRSGYLQYSQAPALSVVGGSDVDLKLYLIIHVLLVAIVYTIIGVIINCLNMVLLRFLYKTDRIK